MNPLILIVLSLVGGGFGSTLFKWLLNRRSENFREGNILRKELRVDLDNVREEVKELKLENDQWRTKYWDLIRINAEQNNELESLRLKIEELNVELFGLRTQLNEILSISINTGVKG